MRRFLFLLILYSITLSMSAVPAKKQTFTHTQSDGTQLSLMLVGDEFLHYYINTVTQEKMTRGENGDYYVIPTATMESMEKEASALRLSANTERTKRLEANRTIQMTPDGPKRVGSVGTYKGSKKGLVILVNFADTKMTEDDTQEVFYNQFNEEGYSENGHMGSVHDYFKAQSYGQFDLSFDVVGPVTVSNEMSYYGENKSSSRDKNVGEMVAEAVVAVDDQVNFADYDWDGDGWVDQVFIIYAGYGENYVDADPNTIWPHEWKLASALGRVPTLDGVTINTYACTSELMGTSGTTMCGIGTACHEFSHCLGYPDTYDTDYSGGVGMGFFDIMDSGNYNGPTGNGEVPSGFTSYERMCAGWLTPTILSEPTTIEDMPALNDEPTAYIIYNQGNKNEYFLVENRQARDWFTYISAASAGHGLFITHVDYDATAWSKDKPNDVPTHQRMSWIAADGTQAYSSSSDLRGDYFPGTSSITSLTNTSHTDAGAKLFNANTDGSYYMNHELAEISENEGTISFLFDVDADYPTANITVYPGSDNPTTVTTENRWNEIRSEYPNAIAIADATNADNVALANASQNIVLEYAVGGNGNKYYECPNFVLTDRNSSATSVDFYSPVNFTAASGSYTRTFNDNTSSCCVPFELSTSDFSISVNILTFAYYEPIYEDGVDTGNAYAYFNKRSTVGAGIPCLVYAGSSKAPMTKTFNNTEIKANPENSTCMQGTFVKTSDYATKGYYMISSDRTKLADATGVALGQFRSVVCLLWDSEFNGGSNHDSASTKPSTINIAIIGEDGEATGIDGITIKSSKTENKDIYTVEGVRVQSINRPGIYIINGKKTIVK